jgi:hypothetical protein
MRRRPRNLQSRLTILSRIGLSGPAAVILFYLLTSGAFGSTDPNSSASVQHVIEQSIPIAIAFMISVLLLKITAFVLGYLIVRLGHDTMIKGVKGDIDFGFSGSGYEVKLKSAIPGGLFVLAGAAIIVWGLTVQKPLDIKYRTPAETKMETKVPPNPRAQVPDWPGGEKK